MQRVESYSKKDRLVYNWLLLGCLLIILMVVIGGITRLTQSGLSMVKWEPIMGTLPPLSISEWNETFDLYKQSPEFHHYNSTFTLAEFKKIFFWEYLHRLLARIIGLVFLFPCIYFWIKKYFSKRLKKQVILIFILGALQGVIGWLMVKSGLVDKPHVSHYRLALHLITALSLMTYIYWVALSVKYQRIQVKLNGSRTILKVFIGLVFAQLIFGAFVAGLKAGLFYNTFPKMGDSWLPTGFSLILKREGLLGFIESPILVQFIHRMIAYSLVIVTGLLWIKARKESLIDVQKKGLILLTTALFGQFALGVFTLIYAVPVVLGVLHQFVAILVLLSSFYYLFSLKKSSN